MVVADVSSPLGDVADLLSKTKLTRIPLVDGSVGKPVGVVHVKDVFAALRGGAPPETALPLAREVLFAPETQSVPTLLADFRRRRQQLAIVVDEYGSVTGLVTLEDLVEELVGEMADEHEDGADAVLPLADGGFSVAGRVRATEAAALFGVVLPPSGYDTVAGLLSEQLGRIPHAGDQATVAGLRFTVEDADRRRVHRVRVERVGAGDLAAAAAAAAAAAGSTSEGEAKR
jgi:CBS domain containing-hemolysin-like protein